MSQELQINDDLFRKQKSLLRSASLLRLEAKKIRNNAHFSFIISICVGALIIWSILHFLKIDPQTINLTYLYWLFGLDFFIHGLQIAYAGLIRSKAEIVKYQAENIVSEDLY